MSAEFWIMFILILLALVVAFKSGQPGEGPR
jgi:hypothetical protein